LASFKAPPTSGWHRVDPLPECFAPEYFSHIRRISFGMPGIVLRVGKRGEIYTKKKMREKVGLKPGGRVYATILGRKIILEVLPTLDEVLKEDKVARLTPEEAEQMSEEAQREAGIWIER